MDSKLTTRINLPHDQMTKISSSYFILNTIVNEMKSFRDDAKENRLVNIASLHEFDAIINDVSGSIKKFTWIERSVIKTPIAVEGDVLSLVMNTANTN